MRSEELLYSLDYVGEDLLDAAGQTVLARKRRPWLRTAVAAVLAAAVCVGGWLILKKAIPADGTPVVGTSPDTAAHTVTETPLSPTGGYEPFAVGESYLDVSAWAFDDWSRFAQINEWTLCTGALRLPVYEAEGALGPETLETRLDQAAQRLGAQRIGGNSVNVNGPFAVAGQGQTGYAAGAEILDVCAWAETDMGTLTVYGNGRVRILFDEAHRIECPVEPEIPKGLTQEQIAAVCRDVNMQACAEKVVRLLDLPPCCSAYCDNWSSLSSSFQAYTIYPIREDPVEQLRSRSFEAVSLLTVDGFRVVGLEWTQLPEPGTVCGEPSDLTRKGLYPIITVQQARQAVCEGRFLCQSRSTNWKLTEDMLSACELVYLGRSGGGVVMPFYRFWVRTDGGGSKEMESCAAVCVPAVSPELLTDFPDPPETADADRTAQDTGYEVVETQPAQGSAEPGESAKGAPCDSLMLNRALTEQVLNLSVYEPGDPAGYGPSRFAIADFVGVHYDASPLTCEGSFQVYAVDPEIPADPDPDALLRLNTYQAEAGLVCYGVLSCVGEGQFRGSILADGSVELAEFSYTALPVPRTGTDTQDPDVPQERWEPFTPQSAEMRTGFETKLRVFPRYGATWASGEALPAGQRLALYAGLKIVHDDGMETDWYLAAPGDGTIGWIPASELRPSQPVTYD